MSEVAGSGWPSRRLWGVLLALIVIWGAVARFAALDRLPPGLFRDEAEKGYNAWALLTSGGVLHLHGGTAPGPPIRFGRWPWMIDVMGARTSALYQYASVPFVAACGLTVGSTRMAAAAVGSLTVLLLGLLAGRLFGRAAGLAAAALLAGAPWHLAFSRWALQGIFVPLFMTLALAGWQGLGQRRRWGWPLLGAALGWLFYVYSGAQPFVLAWGAVLLALAWRRRLLDARRPWLYAGAALFLLPVIPTLLATLAPGGGHRLGQVAVWSDPALSPAGVALALLRNYVLHFDPRFLLLRGDANPRHGVPGAGALPLLAALLLPVGLAVLARRRDPLAWPLLAALLLGPLPAAITREGIPHALRSLPMLISFLLLAAAGAGALCAGEWPLPAGNAWRSGLLRRLPQILLALLLLESLGGGLRYFQRLANDPAAEVAFENGERRSWERLAAGLQPGERVFVNGYIPYAPYYQLFFLKIPPREAAAIGLNPQRFTYFDPQQVTPERLEPLLHPGDWVMQPVAPEYYTDAEHPAGWIDAEQAARGGEPWIAVQQVPRRQP